MIPLRPTLVPSLLVIVNITWKFTTIKLGNPTPVQSCFNHICRWNYRGVRTNYMGAQQTQLLHFLPVFLSHLTSYCTVYTLYWCGNLLEFVARPDGNCTSGWKYFNLDWYFHYYRAMHFSAKRGIAIACRPSVYDVGGLWSHRLKILETNCTDC